MAQLVESQFRNSGCVVSSCPIASSFGKRVMSEGGNAVDAAVVVALALAVTYPQAGNLGGGGFMLIHLKDGQSHLLDYRETAPAGARVEDYDDPESTVFGARAVATPGTIAGLAEALRRFGTWSWDRALAMCIPLAETGTWVTSRQGMAYDIYESDLEQFASTRENFFIAGRVPGPGHLLVVPDLARTFRALAEVGPEVFYEGYIGELIADEIRRGGGVLDQSDLAAYKPRWREPLRRPFRGHELVTAPLPSGGGVVISKTLDFLDQGGAINGQCRSRHDIVLLARAFRAAYFLRQRVGRDPDHMTAEEEKDLQAVLDGYHDLDQVEAELRDSQVNASQPKKKGPGKSTTHFCVLDPEGNAVSNTYSLNTLFGAKLVAAGTGFLLNNSIDDFYMGKQRSNWYHLIDGEANLLRPNHRPVTSMAPTLVTHDGRPRLLIGAAGGPRIPTMITQILLSLDHTTLGDAMLAPRIHHQLTPNVVSHEPRLAEELQQALHQAGFELRRAGALGIGAAIRWLAESDELSASLDPRFGWT